MIDPVLRTRSELGRHDSTCSLACNTPNPAVPEMRIHINETMISIPNGVPDHRRLIYLSFLHVGLGSLLDRRWPTYCRILDICVI